MTNPVGVAEGSGCGNPLSPLTGLLPMGALRFPRPDGRGYPLSPLTGLLPMGAVRFPRPDGRGYPLSPLAGLLEELTDYPNQPINQSTS